MSMSSRVALAAGLGLVCFLGGGWGSSSRGQDTGKAAAPAPAAPPAAVRIGCIDMERVFKEYKRFKVTTEQFKADATAKQGELTKIMSTMRQLASELEGLQPGGNDYKAKEAEMTRLKVELEAQREQAQTEFARREAEALAEIYKEVQAMTAAVARANKFTYVVKVSSEPVTGNDPNSVMAAMARSIVYYEPNMDITNHVVTWLNQRYDQANPAAPAAETGAQPKADPAARPTAATATRRPAANPAAGQGAAPQQRR